MENEDIGINMESAQYGEISGFLDEPKSTALEDNESIDATHSQALENNLPMVSYIMLHRIYDLLTLIANKLVGSDDVSKMVEYHEQGFLLGPLPSYTPSDASAPLDDTPNVSRETGGTE